MSTEDAPPGGYEILREAGAIAKAQAEAASARKRAALPAEDLRVGVLAEDPYLRVERDAVRFPDGAMGLYNRLHVPPGVVVLPLLGDRLVLIRRYRHGTRSMQLEAPRGSLASGISIEEQARIEIREEIGAGLVETWPLGIMHNSTGCSNETHHLLLGRIDAIGELDRHEAIAETLCVTPDEFAGLVTSGEITDAPTLAAFLHALLARLIAVNSSKT